MSASVFAITLGTLLLPATSMGGATRTEIKASLERAAPGQERHEAARNAAGGPGLTMATVPVTFPATEQAAFCALAGGDGAAGSATGAGQATQGSMLCEGPKEPSGGATGLADAGSPREGGKSGGGGSSDSYGKGNKTCTDMFVDCQAKGRPCDRMVDEGKTLCVICQDNCLKEESYKFRDCYKCGFY
jgi:hypothetical protein